MKIKKNFLRIIFYEIRAVRSKFFLVVRNNNVIIAMIIMIMIIIL